MRRGHLGLQALVVGSAAAVAAVPWPPDLVERYYADAWYPAVQASLTSWSNATAFSLFDLVLLFAVGAVLIIWGRSIVSGLRRRSLWPLGRGLLATATVSAVVYLWFACAWGLNYARPPLEADVGFDAARVTPAAVRTLAERAVEEANRAYAAGHAAGFPAAGDIPPSLVKALHDVERRLGRTRRTVPGRPKHTLLGTFFRAAGVDGMHAPFLLETLLNPDLTPPERPAVLAHEWAHLAGYAPEDDASFVGLLAALRADPGARHRAWLTLVFEAAGQLPVDERRHVLSKLGPGPREDQRAIAERMRSRVEVVQRVSWDTYDQYLKAQGVREGIRNYSRVVQLLVGSGALDWP